MFTVSITPREALGALRWLPAPRGAGARGASRMFANNMVIHNNKNDDNNDTQ